MKPTLIPRFRAKAIPDGKAWKWELYISVGPDNPDGTFEPLVMNSKSQFLNKEAAIAALRKALPEIMKEVCKAMGLPEPESIIDLKAGEQSSVKDWRGKS